jgi:hypothetical protein
MCEEKSVAAIYAATNKLIKMSGHFIFSLFSNFFIKKSQKDVAPRKYTKYIFGNSNSSFVFATNMSGVKKISSLKIVVCAP